LKIGDIRVVAITQILPIAGRMNGKIKKEFVRIDIPQSSGHDDAQLSAANRPWVANRGTPVVHDDISQEARQDDGPLCVHGRRSFVSGRLDPDYSHCSIVEQRFTSPTRKRGRTSAEIAHLDNFQAAVNRGPSLAFSSG